MKKQLSILNKLCKFKMNLECLVIQMQEMLRYKKVIQCIVLQNVIEHYIIWIYVFNILGKLININLKN